MPLATLDTILAATETRLTALKARRRELELRAARAIAPTPFSAALEGPAVGVIAEVKRYSPSAGPIAPGLDPVDHAAAYASGGAVAISVLTDEAHFGGSLDDLERVVRQVSVPVLRKDFILDELQLVEARGAGASAVLLIVRALTPRRLGELSRAARGMGLATLIEAHTDAELDLALGADPTAVGVNSRDLTTFSVDLAVAERLVARTPGAVRVIAESGIEHRADVERMAAAGADLVLVGAAVARSGNPGAAVRALTGVPRRPRP